MKTFITWMENNSTKRRLIRDLAKNSGLDRHALDNGGDVPLDKIDPRMLKTAIESLPVNSDEKQKLLGIAQDEEGKNKSGGTLRQIANAINPLSAQQQDKKISQPAVLPPGQGQVPPPGATQQPMA